MSGLVGPCRVVGVRLMLVTTLLLPSSGVQEFSLLVWTVGSAAARVPKKERDRGVD